MEPCKPSVVGVILLEGCVLLLRRTSADRSFPGMWCLPGGRVEEGEDSLAAVIREVWEETGLIPPGILWDTMMRGVTTVDVEGRHYNIDVFVLDWSYTGGLDSSVQLSDEHDLHTWVPPLYILDTPLEYPVGPATRSILEMVAEQVLSFLLAKRLMTWGIRFGAVRLASFRRTEAAPLQFRLGVQLPFGRPDWEHAGLQDAIHDCIEGWPDLLSTRIMMLDIARAGEEDSRVQGGRWFYREEVLG